MRLLPNTKRIKNGHRILFRNDHWANRQRVYDFLVRASRKKRKLFSKNPTVQALQEIRKMIFNIENCEKGGGILTIMSFSKSFQKRIKIINPKEKIEFTIGNTGNDTINLMLINNHWQNLKYPYVIKSEKNGCLFDAVASEIGFTAEEIRQKTITDMKNNKSYLANIIDKISSIPNWKEALDLMTGGAKYTGRSSSDAGRVIDRSQNGRCHPNGQKGHPRGHASHPGASGSEDSVENYSRTGGWKTGFLSRNDQDLVGHLAFVTNETQRAIESLNRGADSEAVHISVRDLGRDDLPRACKFRNGQADGSPQRIQQVTVVLRHFVGEKNNRNEDVFIHTFYPRL